MIRALCYRFLALNIWLKIIWILCLCGLICNTIAIYRDIHQSGILLRLHIGFWVLYAGQVVFILWGERLVWILSLLQGIIALLSNLDFTFVPFVRVLGSAAYTVHGTFSVEELEVYKYVFVAICFTMEMLKTVLLIVHLPSETTVKTPQTQEP